MGKQKSDLDWIREHVQKIVDLGDECIKCYPEIYNDYGNHTPLKLCALKYYIEIYTMILKPDLLKRIGCDGKAFIDVFAGAGVSKVTKDKIMVAGSFPIAMNHHFKNQPFDHYYGVEIDQKKHDALKERSKKYTEENKFTLINGDSNEEIFGIMNDIDMKKYHYLAFVDYEDLRGLSWKGMKRILDSTGDLIITMINPCRTTGLAKTNKSAYKTLCVLYTDDVVSKSMIDDEISTDLLNENYLKLLKQYREHIVTIKIVGNSGNKYTLIYATRNTQSGSSYVKAMEALKTRIEGKDGEYVDSVLSILKRGQKTLFD